MKEGRGWRRRRVSRGPRGSPGMKAEGGRAPGPDWAPPSALCLKEQAGGGSRQERGAGWSGEQPGGGGAGQLEQTQCKVACWVAPGGQRVRLVLVFWRFCKSWF